jgi:hypothetical protein
LRFSISGSWVGWDMGAGAGAHAPASESR